MDKIDYQLIRKFKSRRRRIIVPDSGAIRRRKQGLGKVRHNLDVLGDHRNDNCPTCGMYIGDLRDGCPLHFKKRARGAAIHIPAPRQVSHIDHGGVRLIIENNEVVGAFMVDGQLLYGDTRFLIGRKPDKAKYLIDKYPP